MDRSARTTHSWLILKNQDVAAHCTLVNSMQVVHNETIKILRGASMERGDVVDRDRKNTGKTMVRGGNFPENGYHVVVHICILNARGEMLIQQRQPFKDGWPDMWDITVGGSAAAGDSSQTAAERELFEEIGIKLELAHIRPHLTVKKA